MLFVILYVNCMLSCMLFVILFVILYVNCMLFGMLFVILILIKNFKKNLF